MRNAVKDFQEQRDIGRFDYGGAEIEVSVNAENARQCGLTEAEVQMRMMQDMQGLGRLCLARARNIGGRVKLIMNFMSNGMNPKNIDSTQEEILDLHSRDIRYAIHILTMFRDKKDVTGLSALLELYPYQINAQELQVFNFSADDVTSMKHEESKREAIRLLGIWREEPSHFNQLALYQQMLLQHISYEELPCTPEEAAQIGIDVENQPAV